LLEAPKSLAEVEMLLKFNGVRAQIAKFLREKAHIQWRESERCVLTEIIMDDDHGIIDVTLA
jgi:hypothetical protein